MSAQRFIAARRRFTALLALGVLGGGAVLPASAAAQTDWPKRPVRLIIAYGTGGNTDLRARQIGPPLAALLGQPVIIENKPGAGGNIGTELIATAAPDGYTIGIGNFAPLAVNKTLFGNLRFDPEKDLVPVVLLDSGPLVLCVPANSPYTSLAELIAAARARPGTLSYASGGIGGTHHLSAELLRQSAGLELIHVPYKSGSAATTDLLGGNVNMMFEQMYSALPNIRSGRLRPLAITSARRASQLPDLPTFTELGMPRVVVINWQGIVAPKGTPRPIVDKLNQAVNKVLQDAAIRRTIVEQANEVLGGSPEEFSALVRSESAKWSEVVRRGNIKP
jgi:tripartite-type tricarboxylate transporter receptor subunit TctC